MDTLETENGDVIVCDTPAVNVKDWGVFFDKYQSFTSKIDATLLVYDIGNRDSFDRIQRHGLRLRTHFKVRAKLEGGDYTEEPLFMLVGNKCDLADAERQVKTAVVQYRASQDNVPFMEVSARKNINIESAFITLVEAVKKKREEHERKKAEEAEKKSKEKVWEPLTIVV